MIKKERKTLNTSINNKHLWIASAILLFTFVISRLPFLIHFPIVGFHPDTPVYFMALEGIYNGEFPKFGMVPPLYPMFLFVLGSISDNNLIYVYTQILVSLFASGLLIYVFSKHLPKLTIPISIGLSLFYISSHSIVYDTTLVTESLYVSSWISIFAFFILILNSDKKRYWFTLSILFSIPLLLRPNGIIVFLFIIGILVLIPLTKRSYRLIPLFLLPFFVILATGIVYTYATLGTPFPERVLNYFSSEKKTTYEIGIENYQGSETPYTPEEYKEVKINKKVDVIEKSRKYKDRNILTNVLVFINSVSYESIPFYNKEIYIRHKMLYENNYMDKDHSTNGLLIVPFTHDFKKKLYKNYYPRLPEINFQQCCDVLNNKHSDLNKSILFKTYNFIYQYIFLTFFRNKILIGLLGLVLLLSFYRIITIKSIDNLASYPLFLIGLLLSTAILTSASGHNPGGMRYTYSTEFIFYIVPIFIPYLINSRQKMNKLKN